MADNAVMDATQAPIAVEAIDHVEFYVGNAKQAAFYYQKAFGFELAAYRGPETGHREAASYMVKQNGIRLVLTTALSPDHPASKHVLEHGDGVKDIVLLVPDAKAAFEAAVARGASPLSPPACISDEHGGVVMATVGTYGDTVHTFLERGEYQGPFLPGYELRSGQPQPEVGLARIDHIVGNVEDLQMNRWVDFYRSVFGFHQFVSFDDKDISTEFTALRSVVVASPNERIKFPINEPAAGKRKSQIQEYVDFYRSAGVQHIALATPDIYHAVQQLRDNGVEFLKTPASYYDTLRERVGNIPEDFDKLRELNILVDQDENGYLLQIFTMSVEDRPTLFFEIIQRKGSESFGKGNFKALFESIEREQARRGNL